jgi:hypothetical protein
MMRTLMAEFTFETSWTGGSGAIDRSQRLSAAVASATDVLASSVAQDAGGAETPGSVSEHLGSLAEAGENLIRVFENMAGQLSDMLKRNILISVSEEGAQSRRTGQAVEALRSAAEGARQLNALIALARKPLLDLALTDRAGSVVWERYQ